MGHSIQAIVTTSEVADAISARFRTLPRCDCSQGMVLFPICYQFIDAVVESQPETTSNAEFMLLTGGFRSLLAELSRSGRLAYIETDYFGGTGGQGAVVYEGGAEIMPPTWQESGAINRALALLGATSARPGGSRLSRIVGRSLALLGLHGSVLFDEFSRIGLRQFRNNDAIVEAARRQRRTN